MTSRLKLAGALGWYHTKRASKNIYMFFWLGAVAGSIIIMSNMWSGANFSAAEWALNSVNSGTLGAFLLLPFLVRSFAPGFTAIGGTDFLGVRTQYLGIDTTVTLIINVLVLVVMETGGVMLAAYGLDIPLSSLQMLPMMLFTLPTLLLLTAIMLVLLTVLPLWGAVLTFWVILAGLCFIPGLAPWGGLVWLGHVSADPYSPLMLLNKLFCLLATGLLIYIYTVLQKNQINGLITSRQRYRQSQLAEAKAVIITGKGIVLSSNPWWEGLCKEVKIMGYSRWLMGWAGAAIWGILAHRYTAAAIAGMGIYLIFIGVILSPRNYQDRLISAGIRRRWKFIMTRVILAFILVISMTIIFSLVGPATARKPMWFGFFMVWGWAWLGVHYWSMVGVQIGASLFWLAVVFFPGALNMTINSTWWPLGGLLLILTAVALYRRQLLPR